MFLINSRLGPFTAAHKGFARLADSPHGHPLSQSYRARLSNSLTRVLSFTSGCLPQPTCVGLRYGHQHSCNEAFPDGLGSAESPRALALESSLLSALRARTDLPVLAWPTGANAPCPMGTLYLPVRVPPLLSNEYPWYGNLNPLSIAFAFSLRLRPDLPYVDQRCVGNLRLSVSWILTRIVATHAGILTSQRSTRSHDLTSTHWQRSPTPPGSRPESRGFGGGLEPRYIFGARPLD